MRQARTPLLLLPPQAQLAEISGSGGIAYSGGASIKAFRMADGVALWSVPIAGTPIGALTSGNLLIETHTPIQTSTGGFIDGFTGQATIVGELGILQEGLGFETPPTPSPLGPFAITPAVTVGDSWIGQTSTGLGPVAAVDAEVNQRAFGLRSGNSFGGAAPGVTSIEVRCRPVFGVIIPVDHCFAHTWDRVKGWQTVEGAESRGRLVGTLVMGTEIGWGAVFNRPLLNVFNRRRHLITLVDVTKIRCLEMVATAINDLGVPYSAYDGPNSNSAINTALQYCVLPNDLSPLAIGGDRYISFVPRPY